MVRDESAPGRAQGPYVMRGIELRFQVIYVQDQHLTHGPLSSTFLLYLLCSPIIRTGKIFSVKVSLTSTF